MLLHMAGLINNNGNERAVFKLNQNQRKQNFNLGAQFILCVIAVVIKCKNGIMCMTFIYVQTQAKKH